MPTPDDLFVRLGRLARRAPENQPADELPPALATRVLAQLRAAAPAVQTPWERLSVRAVPLAAIAAAVCLFLDTRTVQPPPPDERALAELIVENQLEP